MKAALKRVILIKCYRSVLSYTKGKHAWWKNDLKKAMERKDVYQKILQKNEDKRKILDNIEYNIEKQL